MKKVEIEESWYNLLKGEFDKEYFTKIRINVKGLAIYIQLYYTDRIDVYALYIMKNVFNPVREM